MPSKSTASNAPCRYCGASFALTRPWKDFCNNRCRSAWHAKEREKVVEELKEKEASYKREIAVLKFRLMGLPAEFVGDSEDET